VSAPTEVLDRIVAVRTACDMILQGQMNPTPDVLLSMILMLRWGIYWGAMLDYKPDLFEADP
jgi:hypothetical protein